VPVQIRATCGRTERPRRALLYSDIEFWLWLHRIDGRLGNWGFGLSGVVLGIPSFLNETSNSLPSAGRRTMSDGQFDWGGRLPKSNGGAQRFPQAVWKSAIECKGIRELDCKRDISSRHESGA
jgi:hypothetical protein